MEKATTLLDSIQGLLEKYSYNPSEITLSVLQSMVSLFSITLRRINNLEVKREGINLLKTHTMSEEQVKGPKTARVERQSTMDKPEKSKRDSPKHKEGLTPRDRKILESDLKQLGISEIPRKTPRGRKSEKSGLERLKGEDETFVGEKVMKKWLNKKQAQVIYDSTENPFNSKNVWRHVKEKKDLAFYIYNDKDVVFGGYFSVMPDKQGKWVSDFKHFIFRIDSDKV